MNYLERQKESGKTGLLLEHTHIVIGVLFLRHLCSFRLTYFPKQTWTADFLIISLKPFNSGEENSVEYQREAQ